MCMVTVKLQKEVFLRYLIISIFNKLFVIKTIEYYSEFKFNVEILMYAITLKIIRIVSLKNSSCSTLYLFRFRL